MTTIGVLFVLNIVLQVLDVTLTAFGVNRGFPEGNPALAYLFSVAGLYPGLAALLVLKLSVFGVLWHYTIDQLWVRLVLVLIILHYMAFAIIPWSHLLLLDFALSHV